MRNYDNMMTKDKSNRHQGSHSIPFLACLGFSQMDIEQSVLTPSSSLHRHTNTTVLARKIQKAGNDAIDRMRAYYHSIREKPSEKPVVAQVRPGYLRLLIPDIFIVRLT